MKLIQQIYRHPWFQWLLQHRFIKFGTVGASGTLVNLAVLYLGQEYLFRALEPALFRLNVSLATAIFFATINNFLLNRSWTWHDRKHAHRDRRVLAQFGQYAMACWIGVALQFVLTNSLAVYFHYILANVVAIAIASLFNFAVNNWWTFRHKKVLALPTPADPLRK
ncbi:MAG: GtrA family protein [Betaproteobacteria bacterium]